VDHALLARELLRELRGRRSQRALSRRLGFESNVIYRWEAGRSVPSAGDFFRLVELLKGPALSSVDRFLHHAFELPKGSSLTDTDGVVSLLQHLRGEARINDLAQAVGCSRFVMTRWLKGTTQLPLPELLSFIEATTLRLLEFLATLVDPTRLPSVGQRWKLLEASRRAAYDHPWSHAVLRVLETRAYEALDGHRRGFIAQRIGISVQEEETCLQILLQAGQIRLQRRRFVVVETQTVDTRADAEGARRLQTFWLRTALERQEARQPGLYSYNLFSISEADYQRLLQLYQAFFNDMRRLIAASEPNERVVLFATQLMPLDASELAPERPKR
jgi:transcriptional regulator with XRE-family HTH domain